MTQLPLFKSSWATNEGFENLRDKLNELIPLQGAVDFPRSKNKMLEKFRVAQNLIYDLFNNGLCNRRSHFVQFFDMPVYTRGGINQYQFANLEVELEPIFTEIMQNAFIEQKNQGVI